jgi:hypothetical protein
VIYNQRLRAKKSGETFEKLKNYSGDEIWLKFSGEF